MKALRPARGLRAFAKKCCLRFSAATLSPPASRSRNGSSPRRAEVFKIAAACAARVAEDVKAKPRSSLISAHQFPAAAINSLLFLPCAPLHHRVPRWLHFSFRSVSMSRESIFSSHCGLGSSPALRDVTQVIQARDSSFAPRHARCLLAPSRQSSWFYIHVHEYARGRMLCGFAHSAIFLPQSRAAAETFRARQCRGGLRTGRMRPACRRQPVEEGA